MNNIESTLWIGFIFIVGMTSLYFLFADISGSGVTLDDESSNMITSFNSQYNNVQDDSQLINSSLNLTGDLPNYGGVAPEFQEAAEAKGTVQTFKTLWRVLVLMPAAMLSTMPFIDQTTGIFITILAQAFIAIVGILQLIALYKALRAGNTNN